MSNMTQLDDQQQRRQLQNYIEHNTRRLFWQHLSRRFTSAVCWWWRHTAHARMTDSLLSALVYLS